MVGRFGQISFSVQLCAALAAAGVMAPASGASGTADLYVVFKGSGSYIGNLNWLGFGSE